MIYGCARVSTKGQAVHGTSLAQQAALLSANGADEIIAEQHTGNAMHRPQLTALLTKIKPKDTLLVTKLDRLARTTEEGISFIISLIEQGNTIKTVAYMMQLSPATISRALKNIETEKHGLILWSL